MPEHACAAPMAAPHEQLHKLIRALRASEIDCFRRHLHRLESECRRSRFGFPVSNSFLQSYADRVDLANTAVYGCFVAEEMRGACELRSLQPAWCDEAELAISVERAWQAQGMGTAFMAHAVGAARHLGIEHLYVTCHLGNRSMQCIANRFAAKITYEDSECFADIAVRWEPMSPVFGADEGGDCMPCTIFVVDL